MSGMKIPAAAAYDVRGYALVYRNGKALRRSRVVMEMLLGRSLVKGEIVHHANEVKSDDRPKNLVLTTANDHHSIFHRRLPIPMNELKTAYESGVSALQLSMKYKTDPKTIRRWLAQYIGVKIRSEGEANKLSGSKRRTPLDEAEIRFLYGRGYGTKTLARFYGMSDAGMYVFTRRLGLNRTCQEAQDMRNFFRSPKHSVLRREVAEWRSRERRAKA